MRMKFLLCCYFLCHLVFVARPVFGQSDFAIVQGRLTQISGSPLVRAEVIAISLANRTRYSALTDGSGRYIIDHLPANDYKVRFEAAGFKPYSEELVSVSASMSTQIDVRLADIDSDQMSGGTSTEPNILKIDRTDVSTTITRHEIESLPILNQNLSRLELLVPGTLSSPEVLPPPQNPQGSAFISVNGQRFSGNGLALDGIINRDPYRGSKLYHSLGPVSNEKDYYASGAGYYLADFIAARLYRDSLTVRQLVILASHVLFQTKEYVPGCGGNSLIAVLENVGDSRIEEAAKIEGITNYIRAADAEIAKLLFSAGDFEVSEEEFVKEVLKLRRAINAKVHEENWQRIRSVTPSDD
jgi:hypothetical protein